MVQIIAECGINHGGNMEIAKEMIVMAKVCGADLAKFQLYDVDTLFPDKKIMAQGKDWYEAVKPTQLTKEQAKMLFEFGREAGIEVFFSVFDVERVKWCEEIGVKRYKIPYSQSTNFELLKAILPKTKVIISTHTPYYNHYHDTSWLYCIPLYPTPLECVNFYRMADCDGFSDHTVGIDASKIAIARGAKIIEKHFCLKRDDSNCDMICSIEPHELKELCDFARVVECVL